MFNYLEWLEGLTLQTHVYFVVLLSLIIVANIVDFLIGYITAHFDKTKQFSSSKAILGVTRKVGILILLVMVIPISVVVPDFISYPAISIFYIGILFAEIRSIMSHVGLASDVKDSSVLIKELFEKMFGGKPK